MRLLIMYFQSVYREDLYGPLINALVACSHKDTVIFLGLTRQFAKVIARINLAWSLLLLTVILFAP